jgi:hypothetical protein
MYEYIQSVYCDLYMNCCLAQLLRTETEIDFVLRSLEGPYHSFCISAKNNISVSLFNPIHTLQHSVLVPYSSVYALVSHMVSSLQGFLPEL